MPRDDAKATIGRTIAGKFEIESVIGQGAMGTVYKARQVALEKSVAIKVMHRSPRTESGGTPPVGSEPSSGDEMFAARFLREAKAASRIDHPNSLRVIDFGEEPDGLLYMAMEFLDGRDLFTVIRQDFPLSPARQISVLLQALAAIAVAHEMGVIHRDLKPENIMVMSGTDDEGNPKDVVKVCDFGIAKITARQDLSKSQDPGAGPKLTTAGLIVGTPEYMSPEQGRGETLDARSDLYSIGVIMFQLMTGKLPFEAETALGVVLKHVTDEPPRPSSLNPNIDPTLEAICLKAMQKKREARYQTAREMRAELRQHAERTSTLASSSQRIGLPLGDRSSLPNAATEVALDSGAVRAAAAVYSQHPRTQSKVTPLGTELDDFEIPRRRWTGLVLAALLLGATLTILFVKLTQKKAAAIDPVTTMPSMTLPNDSDASLADAGDTTLAPLVSNSSHVHHPKAPKTDAGVSDVGTASPTGGNYDPANARVIVAGITPHNTGRRDVQSVLEPEKYSQCFRDGLKGVTMRPARSHANLTLGTDETGKITDVEVSGPMPASTPACIKNAVMGKTMGGAGKVGADVDLLFLPGAADRP